MSLSPGKSAEGRWGAAGLKVAQAVRAQSPAATRPEIVKAIQEQVPMSPKGRRSIDEAIRGWELSGELPGASRGVRSKRAR